MGIADEIMADLVAQHAGEETIPSEWDLEALATSRPARSSDSTIEAEGIDADQP